MTDSEYLVRRFKWLCDELAAGNQFSPEQLQKWSNRAALHLRDLDQQRHVNRYPARDLMTNAELK